MNASVTKAIDLLEELSRARKPLALKDLARNLNLDKATAYRLLNSLRQKGFVQRIDDGGSYGLGPKLLVLAEDYRRCFTMRDTVVPYLEQLVQVTGETAIYCERFQFDSCVTIERRESPHHTRTVIETGVPRPLYVGSSALAILAVLPQEEILSILDVKNFEKFTPFTITSHKQIFKKIQEVNRRGYAVSIQERYSYTAGIAAPCFLSRELVGSIAVIGPAERIRANGIERTGKIVKKFAERLSSTLGYSKGRQSSDASGKRLRIVR